MNGDLIAIIIAVLVWLVPSFISAMSKTLKKKLTAAQPQPRQAQATVADDEPAPFPWHQSQWQVEDDEDELFEDTAVESPSDYFTYETVQPEAPAPAERPAPKAETKQVIPEQAAPSRPMFQSDQFDLRQAVLYQTILTNNYITDLK